MSGVIHRLVHSISTGHRLLLYLFGWPRPLRIPARPAGGSRSWRWTPDPLGGL